MITARRKPNRRQRAWWKAVHEASVRGASIRGIARELGMSRNTVRRYLAAEDPEMVGTIVRSKTSPSDTIQIGPKGHNR